LLGGLMVSMHGNRDKAVAAIESAVEAEDPSLLPSLDVVSLEDGTVALQRGFYRVLGAFAASLTLLSLSLASIGIYGVMAFLVSQRTREIGIRMALGATARMVLSSVLIQGLRPVFLGMAAGLTAAAWLFRLLPSRQWPSDLLSRSSFIDPAVIAALALVLAVAGLACVIPARRALRVDPAVALRHD
jgi:ABC-type antimicrobial peptide transport system permease subunit